MENDNQPSLDTYPLSSPPPPPVQKSNRLIIIVSIIVALLLLTVGVSAFYLDKMADQKPEPSSAPLIKTSTISPTPTIDLEDTESSQSATANWKTYVNAEHGYSVKYQNTAVPIEGTSNQYVWLDDQILIGVSDANPEDCRGGCPLIKQASDVTIGQLNARKIIGEIGAVGGNVPQSYIKYAFPQNNQFYILTVYELKNDVSLPPSRTIGQIPESEVSLFDQMSSTFKFTQ